ncbi:MAG: zf-HC2 domain-containing protein [Ignavibacteria bacterium]|jgi:hypothetical protein|nr:zf-HC2 domain-containing protein [Ignavibacteria bacterium]MDP3832316.1 zf-HC2 domain-containing protein [Ignavibacteriaceae bacterium]
MKCEINEIKLHLFIDEELNTEDKEKVIHHIKHCKNCCEELEFLTSLRIQFTKLQPVNISDALLTRLTKIGKKKICLPDLLKDIFKIVAMNSLHKCHIDKKTEMLLYEKYPIYIVRWVFFC